MTTRHQKTQRVVGRRVRGFTIVELLLVITILTLLATLMTSGFSRVMEGQRKSATLQMFTALDTALNTYSDKRGGFPWDSTETVDNAAGDTFTICRKAPEEVLDAGNVGTQVARDINSGIEGEPGLLYQALGTDKVGNSAFAPGVEAKRFEASGSKFVYLYVDAWDRPIDYRYASDELILVSAGADGQFAGDPHDDDADDLVRVVWHKE